MSEDAQFTHAHMVRFERLLPAPVERAWQLLTDASQLPGWYGDGRIDPRIGGIVELMGSDVFFYHGYTDVWLDGRWVKATPAFNRELTERFGLKPLDWDAVGDSIYHPFDLSGRRHMEYLAYRGVFADIPFDEIRGAFRHYYPRMTRAQEEMPLDGRLGGDFGAEGAAEAKSK